MPSCYSCCWYDSQGGANIIGGSGVGDTKGVKRRGAHEEVNKNMLYRIILLPTTEYDYGCRAEGKATIRQID